jgi:hypothetical protein
MNKLLSLLFVFFILCSATYGQCNKVDISNLIKLHNWKNNDPKKALEQLGFVEDMAKSKPDFLVLDRTCTLNGQKKVERIIGTNGTYAKIIFFTYNKDLYLQLKNQIIESKAYTQKVEEKDNPDHKYISSNNEILFQERADGRFFIFVDNKQ